MTAQANVRVRNRSTQIGSELHQPGEAGYVCPHCNHVYPRAFVQTAPLSVTENRLCRDCTARSCDRHHDDRPTIFVCSAPACKLASYVHWQPDGRFWLEPAAARTARRQGRMVPVTAAELDAAGIERG